MNGDTRPETGELLRVNLKAPSVNASIDGGQGNGIIVDDEVHLYISNAQAPRESTTSLAFWVVLSAPSAQPMEFNFSTQNGSGIAGVDYVATSGTLTFAPGETEKQITVAILPAPVRDADFYVSISGISANAIGLHAQGWGNLYVPEPYSDGGRW